ncbi:MAG: hypothetical protein ABJI96_12475 [Paracoccaceae bacterium]
MKQIEELVNITETLYLKEQAAVQEILSKEATLRAKLAEIDFQVQQARDNSADMAPMQTIGGDVIWMAWVGRAKAQLNMQLAQVLARKSLVMGKVRQAFGKRLVAGQLAEAETKAHLYKRRVRILASAYDNSGFK